MSVVDYSDVEGSYQDPPSIIIDTENVQVPLRPNDLSNRPVVYKNVAHFLREKTDKMARCTLSSFEQNKLIGKGKNGLIYELKAKDVEDKDLVDKIVVKVMDDTLQNKWEVYYSKHLTNIVLRNQSPHFPMVWLDDHCGSDCHFIEPDNFTDEEDRVKWKSVEEKSCYLMFLEKFDTSLNLDDLIVLTKEKLVSFVMQMMMAFSVLQGENLVHNDCHHGNVLIKLLKDYDNTPPYIGYRIGTETIYVKHEDMIFVLSDFGMMTTLEEDDTLNLTSYLPDVLKSVGIEDDQIPYLRKSVYLDMAVLLKSLINDDKKMFSKEVRNQLDRMIQFFVKEALNGGKRPMTSPYVMHVMMEVFGDDPFLTYIFSSNVIKTYDYHVSDVTYGFSHTDSGDVIFGKKEIESLSGPVSFYYLRPSQTVYENNDGQYFPLIVLFGDLHRGLENTCNRCGCFNEGNGCCYSLSDHRFLKKLDTLANPRHPVDFYTETTLSGTEDGFKGGMMEDLTTGEMVSCYHRGLRGTRYDKCPTKNIRWQAGETRHIQPIMKRHDNDEWFYHGKDYFVRDLYQNPSNIPKMEKTRWIEKQFSTILQYFWRKDNELTTYISRLLHDGVFKNIEGLQSLLLTLCDDDHDILDFNKFSKAFFSLLTKEKDNSLIYKQIEKQSYPPFRDVKQWPDLYRRSLLFYGRSAFFDSIEKQKLKETILKLSSALSDPHFKFNSDDYKNLEWLVLGVCTPLLDIYTLARIWKQPTGGIRSSLSFGYFGNNHVKNIVQLLLSTNAYELIYENPMTDDLYNVSRCKTFDKTLNLSEEVRLHNQHNQKIKI